MWSKTIWEGKKCGWSVICPEDSTQQVRGKPLSVRGPYWRTPRRAVVAPPRCTFPLVAQRNCALGQVGKALSKRWICSNPSLIQQMLTECSWKCQDIFRGTYSVFNHSWTQFDGREEKQTCTPANSFAWRLRWTGSGVVCDLYKYI